MSGLPELQPSQPSSLFDHSAVMQHGFTVERLGGIRTGHYPAPSLRGVLFRMNWGSDRAVLLAAPRASVFGVCDERRPALRPMGHGQILKEAGRQLVAAHGQAMPPLDGDRTPNCRNNRNCPRKDSGRHALSNGGDEEWAVQDAQRDVHRATHG